MLDLSLLLAQWWFSGSYHRAQHGGTECSRELSYACETRTAMCALIRGLSSRTIRKGEKLCAEERAGGSPAPFGIDRKYVAIARSFNSDMTFMAKLPTSVGK